ncbi:hypothetical protein BaRGS_00003231 [Batillaria attramentaria]|uniref:Uncharacterized protein n=1 Tax=Batillaria attramentaria TaxID=370345 RepID=A0ABD0M2F8_9CAEN
MRTDSLTCRTKTAEIEKLTCLYSLKSAKPPQSVFSCVLSGLRHWDHVTRYRHVDDCSVRLSCPRHERRYSITEMMTSFNQSNYPSWESPFAGLISMYCG